jgi:uncharacterized protein YbgA (DUF1722 family)
LAATATLYPLKLSQVCWAKSALNARFRARSIISTNFFASVVNFCSRLKLLYVAIDRPVIYALTERIKDQNTKKVMNDFLSEFQKNFFDKGHQAMNILMKTEATPTE